MKTSLNIMKNTSKEQVLFFSDPADKLSETTQKKSEKPQYSQSENKNRDQNIMAKRASRFINQLRQNKKQFEGKLHMIKRAEIKKREEQFKKLEIQKQMQKQLQRKIRRMKAEANVEYYTHKKKLKENLIQNKSFSPKSRKLSELTDEDNQEVERFKLPEIQGRDLQQIKQQEGGCIPEGIPTARKSRVLNKRAKTQNNQHQYLSRSQNSAQQPAHKIQLFNENCSQGKRVFRQRLRSDDYKSSSSSEKKTYLISRNRTDDISEYLQHFSHIDSLKYFVQQKKQKRNSIKNFIKTKRVNRALQTTHVQNIEADNSLPQAKQAQIIEQNPQS